MSVTIPLLTTIPSSTAMNESEYNTAWNTLLSELDPYANAANALAAGVEANAADAEAAVAELASAEWVSGSFAKGDVRWSPADYLNYRCKNAGSRTIDPAADPTNWALQTKTGAGGSDTTSSAVDITLTSTSGRLQIIAMTAAEKKVIQPAANTLQIGAPIFVYKNTGTYRFSVHKNGGGFLCYVNPGQVVMTHCSDISSGAGVWSVSGQDVGNIYGGNTAEVINAADSRYLAVAMLTSTKAVCAFVNNSTTYLEAVVLNYGSASGVAVTVNGEASKNVSIAAQTSSQVTVVYQTTAGVTKGYVLDISGSSFTPGAVKQIDGTTGGAGTALTALSATQLLCVYQNSSGGAPRERVLDISASAITESAQVTADATTANADHLYVGKVSSSKSLVAFRSTAASTVWLRLQSITGSVPAPTGSAVNVTLPGGIANSQFGVAILSADRAAVVQVTDRTYGDILITVVDISGLSPVILSHKLIHVGLYTGGAHISACKIDSNTIYASWLGGESLGIDAIKITVCGDDLISVSEVAPKLFSSVSSAAGYLSCASLDATHVMHVCRNSSTYLSAKTIELAA